LGFLHGMSVKFGVWTFHKLSKRQKILTFGCPSHGIIMNEMLSFLELNAPLIN